MLLIEGEIVILIRVLAPLPKDASPRCFLLVNFKCDGADSIRLFCGLAKNREVSSSFYRAKIRLILNVPRRPDLKNENAR